MTERACSAVSFVCSTSSMKRAPGRDLLTEEAIQGFEEARDASMDLDISGSTFVWDPAQLLLLVVAHDEALVS